MLRFQTIVHGDAGGRPGPLSVRFEEVVTRLEALPRMFVEPDGSFLWAQREADGTTWQVEGNLVDAGASLAHVELSGECPRAAVEQILAALGWPGKGLLFQLPRRGVLLAEKGFWEIASGQKTKGGDFLAVTE